ncbi:MAG TPA: acetate--CoA ligase family protein, partial [Acidimicrobiia bacterium]
MPTLSEAESKRLLAAFGVPMVPDRLVADPEGAAAAAAEFGGPVAVKLCGANVAHKTERGLVRLGIEGAAVGQAAADLLGAALPDDGDVALLVAPMVRGTRELIAGLHRDAQFGMT